MKSKLSIGIVAMLCLGLTGCMNHHYGYEQSSASGVSVEPDLVTKPFTYSGRTWFDTDKAVLRPSGKKALTELSKKLMQAKQKGVISAKNKLAVIGHTDSRASHAYNQKLSERRAKAVAQFLQSQGIPSTSIVAFGKGETQPVATNRTRRGMQKNRRVELHIQGPVINVVYH